MTHAGWRDDFEVDWETVAVLLPEVKAPVEPPPGFNYTPWDGSTIASWFAARVSVPPADDIEVPTGGLFGAKTVLRPGWHFAGGAKRRHPKNPHSWDAGVLEDGRVLYRSRHPTDNLNAKAVTAMFRLIELSVLPSPPRRPGQPAPLMRL